MDQVRSSDQVDEAQVTKLLVGWVLDPDHNALLKLGHSRVLELH